MRISKRELKFEKIANGNVRAKISLQKQILPTEGSPIAKDILAFYSRYRNENSHQQRKIKTRGDRRKIGGRHLNDVKLNPAVKVR